MQIRQATQDDAPHLALALAAIHRAARAVAMPWLPVMHSPEEDRWFFAQIVLPRHRVWLACGPEHPVGFAAREGAWLNHLYVARAFWRRGIGAALLGAAQEGCDQLNLWTFQRNLQAQRFYTAQGFVACETTDGQGNEEKTPDVRMQWDRPG